MNKEINHEILYYFCQKIYSHICDLIEDENNIKIDKTKNVDIFYLEIKKFFSDFLNDKNFN